MLQFASVIKNDNTRRKLPQITSEEIAPNIMHMDVPTVQHLTSSATCVVTLDNGSQCAEELPLPRNRIGKNNNPKKTKNHGKKRHIDLIEMDEFNGQYDDIDAHFVGPYPDIASDPEEIMIDDIKRPRKPEAYTIVHLPADFDGKTNASAWSRW